MDYLSTQHFYYYNCNSIITLNKKKIENIYINYGISIMDIFKNIDTRRKIFSFKTNERKNEIMKKSVINELHNLYEVKESEEYTDITTTWDDDEGYISLSLPALAKLSKKGFETELQAPLMMTTICILCNKRVSSLDCEKHILFDDNNRGERDYPCYYCKLKRDCISKKKIENTYISYRVRIMDIFKNIDTRRKIFSFKTNEKKIEIMKSVKKNTKEMLFHLKLHLDWFMDTYPSIDDLHHYDFNPYELDTDDTDTDDDDN